MKVSATEFKAKCLRLMDQMGQGHEPILITKHGKVVAQLAPAPLTEKKPWLALRGTGKIRGNIVGPATKESEFDCVTGRELRHRQPKLKA